ncbi:uncharacterized protein KY384_000699 [Bacidia gigantensis]|uniref:uncharacterized protein n=1 Tax=Bacidia gigantensis TaxID=2732470 RepID=UPI001D03FF33|nr:uncharacterized protein KY384_000699 [Bacidia gigantensis]KAG8525937.1 hypothetical protein KY384_000699 [Bacidia gigantensis]
MAHAVPPTQAAKPIAANVEEQVIMVTDAQKPRPGWPHANDPFTQHDIWSDGDIIELTIIRLTVAESGLNDEEFGKVAAGIAQFCREGLRDNKTRHITTGEFIEGWHYMKDPENLSLPQNPYKSWRRACDAFSSGTKGEPYDFEASPNEVSLTDFKKHCEDSMVETLRRTADTHVVDNLRGCIKRSIDEMSEGRLDDHRPHRGDCKLHYQNGSHSDGHRHTGSGHREGGECSQWMKARHT